MIQWVHLFESVVRENIMAGACDGAELLISWPRSEKEEEEGARVPISPSGACLQ
jgi:hypothetical protein